jgi:hypothetical protein
MPNVGFCSSWAKASEDATTKVAKTRMNTEILLRIFFSCLGVI